MTAPSKPTSGGGTRALGTGAILLSALWIYWPALRGGWLWDDNLEVAGNAVLRDSAGWWKPWVSPAGMDYFPLKNSLQWLEWHLWGGNVLGYHLASLALHVIAALLVWRLLARLFQGAEGLAIARKGDGGGAWLGGLLFVIHPVAVESVAWISEQKNLLSTVFCLLSAVAYLGVEDADTAEPAAARRRTGEGGGALLLFILAMLCKSTVAALPAVLLLHAWWRRGRIARSDLARSAPFFTVSLVLGLVTVWFQGHRAIGIGGPMPAFGPRLAEAGWSALAYLRDCLWPSRLAAIYLPAGSAWLGGAAWLVLALLFIFLWRRRRSWGRHALLGLGWFTLNLAPVLGLLPMSYLRIAPRADHFAYLPLVGIVGLAGAAAAAALEAAWLAGARREPGTWRCCRLAALAAVLAILACAARSHASVFRDSETFWVAAVERSPESWLAESNLGRERLREGRLPEALSLFGEAADYGPPSAEVHANLGSVYERMGRAADARAQVEQSIRLDPGFAGGHYNLGNLLLAAGEPARAADEFRAALRLDPASAMSHNNFGVALARQGRGAEAMIEYRAALKLDPGLADAWVNLGNGLYRLGRRDEAVKSYRAALAIAPDNAAARHNLAAARSSAP